jgi:hypothetical protein
MREFKSQAEIDAALDEDGNLTIHDNVRFCCDVALDGNIDVWDIRAGNIEALDINAGDIKTGDIIAFGDIDACDIDACDIDALDITAGDISAGDISARNIAAGDIKAGNISYHAFCVAYRGIECDAISGRRENHAHPICLDGKLAIRKPIKENEK